MTFLIISFVAGVLTILAPCILPLLPVIVGHSLSDSSVNKRRLFTVILSLGVSIILFTFLLKASTLLIDIPQDFWKWISGGIIFLFGLTMLFPELWEKFTFTGVISRRSNEVLTKGYNKNNILGDIVIGASLGPIFSACSPTYFVILATVLPVSPILGIVYLLAYVLGLCLMLLIVAFVGQGVMSRLGTASDPRGWFKRILGIIFILVAIGIVSGYDKELQIKLLDSGFLDVTKIEQKLLKMDEEKKSLESVDTQVQSTEEDVSSVDSIPDSKENFLTVEQKKLKYILAPDITTPDGFVNTNGRPITIKEFRGKKVVLLDIWTYSCINCQRTIPYLNEWYKKYEDEGLVIIGLHTPEFAFERIQKNVEDAVKRFDIKYPVVLDNDFSTWSDYKNQYWPRKYLIDIDGYIVYDHAGEGQYKETEQVIQRALRERNSRLGEKITMISNTVDPANKIIVDSDKIGSPEIYFGAFRNGDLANGKQGIYGIQNLVIPASTLRNKLYLGGDWVFAREYAENTGGGTVFFKYKAKNVYAVASGNNTGEIEIYIDGKYTKTISISSETLYQIVEGTDYQEHTLELKIKTPGVKMFTFTFG